jgi:putative CocE/NonD family hydrolase
MAAQRTVCSPATHAIQTDHRYRIPMRDGLHLGANICRPTDSGTYPALLWCDPYRSGTLGGASPMAAYFAARGYAFVYLDSRGTGNSEGVSRDEYMVAETADSCDTIAWLADQPWCSGSVGMLGASYSGFTAIQAAAAAPPALKAIAPAYFTDRRYTDDCHYKGGCLRGYYDMLTYGLGMVARNGLPPAPEAVGDAWSTLWRQRLEESEPYLAHWLQHPVEDDYWQRGSVAGLYDRISAACLLIGGWHDGYVNPPLRTFAALSSPKRLLMGPWSHSYPNISHCGPRIDIHFELLRWFDRYLKDMDNGVENEPAAQIYVQELEPPHQHRTAIAGSWRSAADWQPPPAPLALLLGTDLLAAAADDDAGHVTVAYQPAASRNGGIWDAGIPFTLAGDQRPDDAYAACFTGAPLSEDLTVLGMPAFTLYVSASVPILPVAVRLCEVAPDGTSVLVTKGILNLTRRDGMATPSPMPVDEVLPVSFHLEGTAWRFAAGNRLRLSINGSDFPNVWPTPLAGQLRIHWGPEQPSVVHLPLWQDSAEMPFTFPPSPDAARSTGVGTAPWRVEHRVLEDEVVFRYGDDREFGVCNRAPARAWAAAKSAADVAWPGCAVRSRATGSLTSDATIFRLNLALNVSLNDSPFFSRQWTETIPRHLL